MAFGGRDVLKLIVDADTSGAARKLQGLGQSANKSLGGIATSGAGLTKLLSVGVAGAAVAGAGALATFALKGVKAFQNTALAAGKFADATGLSTQQASRWMEVADDVGIGAETLQSAFGKMEKAIGANREAFGDLVATSKDGSTDLNATFLNVIEHLQGISDPIERATEASKFFGKGFQGIAEITATSADELRSRLSAVADVKVISDDELAKAREYRAAMDELGDAVQEAEMQLGQALVPALTGVAKFMTVFLKGVDIGIHGLHDFGEGASDASKKLAEGDDNIKAYNKLMDELAHKADAGRSAQDMFIGSADGVTASMGDMGDAVSEANAVFKRQDDAIRGLIDAQLAMFDSTFAVGDAQRGFSKAVADTTAAMQDGTTSADDLQASYDDQAQAALRVADATVKYAQDQAIAKTGTDKGVNSQKLMIDTLSALAAKASGPVKATLEAMIGQLKKVGAQKPNPTVTVTTTKAMADAGTVQRKMDQLDKLRPKPILSADASIAQARTDSIIGKIRDYGRQHASATLSVNDNASGAIARAIRLGQQFAGSTYTADVNTRRIGIFARGGQIPGPPSRAVPIIAHGGEYVLPANVVSAIKRGVAPLGRASTSVAGGSGQSTGNGTTVIINGALDPLAVGRQVKQILATAERAGVR